MLCLIPGGHPLPARRLLAAAHSRANKLESASAAGCQLGLLTAIWGARLSKSSPTGPSGGGRMSSAPLIQSDSDGQVQRGEMMAKVFLLSGQCLKRWTWRSQGFKVQQCMCACVCTRARGRQRERVRVCVHVNERLLQSADVVVHGCQMVKQRTKCEKWHWNPVTKTCFSCEFRRGVNFSILFGESTLE